MDTKLKKTNKRKRTIGSKLLLSYLVILLITFTVSLLVFNKVAKDYLVNEAKSSIEEEMTEIMRFVKLSTVQQNSNLVRVPKGATNSTNTQDDETTEASERVENFSNLADTIAQARVTSELRIAGRYFDSKIAIVTDRGKIRYASEKDMTLEKLKKIAEAAINDTEYIFKREEIKINNNQRGYVIIYTAVDDVVSMRNLGFRVFALSFSIGGLLALIISVFLQRIIGRPIKKLSLAMQSYSFNEPAQALEINTGDEIEELATTFEMMSDKIQSYHGQQKVFFQNASHELKTPLMSIQGYAEAIKDGIVEGDEKDESLDIIIAESQRLKKIVEEMILLTKLEDEQEPFDFRDATIEEILMGSMRSLSSLFNMHEVEVDLRIDDKGYGKFDVDKLTRGFINILGNCARYAHETITVKVNAIADIIYVEIADDGDGFQPGEAAKVFERFYKGNKGGSGIGLALTKTIIERHGGEVWAEDNPTGGAVFKIKIEQRQN